MRSSEHSREDADPYRCDRRIRDDTAGTNDALSDAMSHAYGERAHVVHFRVSACVGVTGMSFFVTAIISLICSTAEIAGLQNSW